VKLLAVLACVLSACGGGDGGGPGAGADAPMTADASLALPGWMLEDIQPASPRTGQTYGLDAYTDHIVVVTLLEGF